MCKSAHTINSNSISAVHITWIALTGDVEIIKGYDNCLCVHRWAHLDSVMN